MLESSQGVLRHLRNHRHVDPPKVTDECYDTDAGTRERLKLDGGKVAEVELHVPALALSLVQPLNPYQASIKPKAESEQVSGW